MIKIEKVYMESCEPCKEVAEILKDLIETKDFELVEYDIESSDFKERKNGKKLLTKWGTTKVPLLLFSIENEVKRAIYGGHTKITKESVLNVLSELENEQEGTKESSSE